MRSSRPLLAAELETKELRPITLHTPILPTGTRQSQTLPVSLPLQLPYKAPQELKRWARRLKSRTNLDGEVLSKRIKKVAPHLSVLQSRRLKANTQMAYLQAMELFLGNAAMSCMPDWPRETWDSELVEALDRMYQRGAAQQEATHVVSATMWLNPSLVGSVKMALPGAKASLKGWLRLEPAGSRPLIPWVILWQLILQLLANGDTEAALITWLAFEGYFRISELRLLRAFQLTPPTGAVGQSQAYCAFSWLQAT